MTGERLADAAPKDEPGTGWPCHERRRGAPAAETQPAKAAKGKPAKPAKAANKAPKKKGKKK